MKKFSVFTWLATGAMMLSLVSVGRATTCSDLANCEGSGTVKGTLTSPALPTPPTAARFPGGTVDSYAVAGDSLNPFVTGGDANALTFIFQVHLTADSLSSITFNGFGNDSTQLVSDCTGVLSCKALTANGVVFGSADFSLSPDTPFPFNSNYLLVFTSSDSFSPNFATLNEGGTSEAVTLGAVPEPSSMLLFGTGLSGFAAMLRRRSKKVKL